jgi:hypothetical protein
MIQPMKRILWLALILGLTASAAQAKPTKKESAPPPAGLEAAKAITTITGIAISPLLGTSAIGAWDYFNTPDEKRDQLVWYAHPSFWLPALLLVGAVALKDAAGTALPPGLKKPLDVAETAENKLSGLVAAGAVVPSIAAIFPMVTHSGAQAAAQAPVYLAGFAAFNVAGLLDLLTVPLAMTAFGLVWLVAHAINVLILLSPWGVVDAALKSFRTFLLGLVTVTHFVNPMAGMVLSLIIIVLAYFLAGWSFRLMIFGSVYVWDFVSGKKRRFTPAPNDNWMFTARKIEKTPVRTYGKLHREADGTLTFAYRPWLLGKPHTVTLPAGTYAVGSGLFYSELLLVQGETERMMVLLPPRYRTHEEELVKLYGFLEVRATGLRRTWRWLKSILGFGAKIAPATA